MKRAYLILLMALPVFGQNCMPPAPLQPNDTQAGELNDASCLLSSSARTAQYRLVLPVRGTLQLTANAGFGASFLIRDADGRKVEAGTRISRYLEAGTYVVLLIGSGTGTFSFTSVFTPEPNVLCTAFNKIGVGTNLSGQLSAASCKLPDGSLFDGWQTTVYGSGTLTVSMHGVGFNSYVMLRDADGTLLAAGANPAAADGTGFSADSKISLPVSGRDTYMIVASAASSSAPAGAYQLSTSFTPDDQDTCLPLRVLTDAVQLSASVSAASCNFNLPERQDSSLFNVYGIHVAQAGTVQISVPTATFTPLLLLLDQNGNSLVEDSESGGLYTPNIRQSLPPGDYSVLIFNEDSFEGDYTLQYNFIPGPASACATQTLTSGQMATGTLNGDTSCRFYELLTDLYVFTLTAPATVEFTLASSDFTTFLELRDATDNLLSFSDPTAGGTSAYLKADLPAGTYAVDAASVDLPGNYTLNPQFTPKVIPPCSAPQDLPVNTGFIGVLGQGTCLGPAGEPVDRYSFRTTADGTAALAMTSGDLDSFLTLKDSAGTILRRDDNSYTQDDALIVQPLKAGVYQVEARSQGDPGAGKYRIDLLWTATAKPKFCAATPIAMGATVSSTLTYTACQYYDDTFADIYQFNVVDPSQLVYISAASTDFDSFLILTDAKGNVLQTDDNSGGGSDASLAISLDAGMYYLVLKPAADPSQSGGYRVSLHQ